MKKISSLRKVMGATLIAVIGAAVACCEATVAPRAPLGVRVAVNYSASGTHQCRTADGATHSCVASGSFFGNCIDAQSALMSLDCCPSTRACERDAQGRETRCQRGGASTGFTMNYCIPGR
jgi:hypothetical protein